MKSRRWLLAGRRRGVGAWVLVPIWLIAGSAVGGEATWSTPGRSRSGRVARPLAPLARISSHIEGVWTSVLISVEVAVLCMVFSILLGAPAGYALARYRFRGATLSA